MEDDDFTISVEETIENLESNQEALGTVDLENDGDEEWVQDNNKPSSPNSILMYNNSPTPNVIGLNVRQQFTTDKDFESKDAARDWCKARGVEINSVVVTDKSEPNLLILRCERSGKYISHQRKLKEPESRVLSLSSIQKRSSGIIKCECPFKLRCMPLLEGRWEIEVLCGFHNHELRDTLVGHSYVGRLTTDEKAIVEDLTKIGIKSRDILVAIMKNNPANKSTIKTISNAKILLRKKQYEGRSMLQQLMHLLTEKKYDHYALLGKKDVVRSLFWAHPDSIALLKCFPEVLIVDCTYKTNRYKLPLLQIVGSTSTHHTFVVAMCFLESEKAASFDWAFEQLLSLLNPAHMPRVIVSDRDHACISAIEHIFPKSKQLVCDWHVRKNITANCKKGLNEEEWKEFYSDVCRVIYASTTDEYTDTLTYFEATWGPSKTEYVEYIRNTWWPLKEKFIPAWTNEIMHYGHSTTQRAESAHHELKRHLRDCTSTLESIFVIVDDLILVQINKIQSKFEKCKHVTKHKHAEVHELRELLNKVSFYALDLLKTEVAHAKNYLNGLPTPCDHTMRSIAGLPCACDIKVYIESCGCIPLEKIDPHWRQLCMKPNQPETRGKTEINPILVRLGDKWERASEKERFNLARKVEFALDPVTTAVKPPITMVQGKGRPKGLTKKQMNALISTKRDPSAFEYVESKERKRKQSDTSAPLWYKNSGRHPYPYAPAASSVKAYEVVVDIPSASSTTKHVENLRNVPLKIPKVEKEAAEVVVLEDPMVMMLPLMPICMQPFIENIHDVRGDGNCGFRAVARQLGYDPESGWIRVKAKLKYELSSHLEFYKKFFLGGQFENVKKSLSRSITPASRDYWMSMQETGHLIATALNVVLVYLSKPLSLTFFPFRGTVPQQHRVISIAYLPYPHEHFVGLTLQRDHPMPPIAVLWAEHCDVGVASYSDPYSLRLQHFEEIRPPDMASNEAHVID